MMKNRLSFRLSRELAAAITAHADRDGMSAPAWLREAAAREIDLTAELQPVHLVRLRPADEAAA
jgi:hypothetical protein